MSRHKRFPTAKKTMVQALAERIELAVVDASNERRVVHPEDVGYAQNTMQFGEAVRKLWSVGLPVSDVGGYWLCTEQRDVDKTKRAFMSYCHYMQRRSRSLRAWAERVGIDGKKEGGNPDIPFSPRLLHAVDFDSYSQTQATRRAIAVYETLEQCARRREQAMSRDDIKSLIEDVGIRASVGHVYVSLRRLADLGVPIAGDDHGQGYYLAKIGRDAIWQADRCDRIAAEQVKRCDMLDFAWQMSQDGKTTPVAEQCPTWESRWGEEDRTFGGEIGTMRRDPENVELYKDVMVEVLSQQAPGLANAMAAADLAEAMADAGADIPLTMVKFVAEELALSHQPIGWTVSDGYFWILNSNDYEASQTDFLEVQSRLGRIIYGQQRAFLDLSNARWAS